MNGPKAHEQAIGEVQQEAAGGHRGTRRVKATGAREPRRGRVVPGPSRRPAVRPRGRPRCETVWQPLENRGAQLLRDRRFRSWEPPRGDRPPARRAPEPGRARQPRSRQPEGGGGSNVLHLHVTSQRGGVWPWPRVRTRRRHTVPRGRARKAACFTIPLMRTAQKPEAGARGGAGGEGLLTGVALPSGDADILIVTPTLRFLFESPRSPRSRIL